MFTPNAYATFEREVTTEEEDAWGDPIETTEWVTTLEDVPARFTPAQIRDRNSAGDTTREPAELKAPMQVDDEGHGAGDRVTVTFRGQETTYRMVEYGAVTTFGTEGSIKAELADWGDDFDD